MGVVSKQLNTNMHIHVFIMFVNSYQRRLKTFMVETHLLILYRVVAYVRFLGGQQVYIYFHKIRPMALRLQTKETHTVDESLSIGCLQSDPAYYSLRSAIACSTRILYFRIRELNFRYALLSSNIHVSCAHV